MDILGKPSYLLRITPEGLNTSPKHIPESYVTVLKASEEGSQYLTKTGCFGPNGIGLLHMGLQ